jgi:hypothetical protein
MPRWLRENKDKRRDLLGFSVTQTCVMDSSKATVIDGASEEEELQQQLRQAEYDLKRYNQTRPVRILAPDLTPPPRTTPITDWDEEKKQLVIIGYRLE